MRILAKAARHLLVDCMTDKPDNEKWSRIRRQDREVHDEQWIRNCLARAPYGIWATSVDGQPFTHVNTFIYDDSAHAIYLHSGHNGLSHRNVLANDRVSFCVAEAGRCLPGPVASAFSIEYASVVIFGRTKIIQDKAEAMRALQMLLDKYFPHLRPDEHYRHTTTEELQATCVYRIDIDRWTAKRNRKSADFPGAFPFRETPSAR